jgi:hypothetical protein
MRHDEFEQHERAAGDIIHAIGRASDDIRVPPDFRAQVMAKAEPLTSPRPAHLHWRSMALTWMSARRLRVAMALVFVLALGGAIPQYATWFKAFTAGVPSTTLHTALEQERLWEKNFTCATRLDQDSEDYAAITGDKVHVVVWACPSGDVLVTTESPQEAASPRSVWVPLAASPSEASQWTPLIRQVFAAGQRRPGGLRLARIVSVLCQKWLRDGRILRRVRLDNGSCRDEVINTRTGEVVQSRPAPCDPRC